MVLIKEIIKNQILIIKKVELLWGVNSDNSNQYKQIDL